MSTSPQQQPAVSASTGGSTEENDVPPQSIPNGKARDALASSLKFAGFWTAIALPFLYLPLLATGLDTPSKLATFAILLALNVVAAVVGHYHNLD